MTSHSLSRGGGHNGLGGSFSSPIRGALHHRSTTAQGARRRAKAGRRRSGDRSIRGSITSGAVGLKKPTLETHPRRVGARGSACPMEIRRSGRGRRETSGPLVSHVEPQSSEWRPRGESRGRSWEHARCGCTEVVRVADVDRTRRASCPPGDRKISWRARALARRKPEAPPDAGHGWREGETVRGPKRFPNKVGAKVRPMGFGS